MLNSPKASRVMALSSQLVSFLVLVPISQLIQNPSGDPLSISHISSSTTGIQCTFNGIDQSMTTVTGAELVDVGPPQTQVSASCHDMSMERRDDTVHVTFIGAADGLFTQDFPVDGESVQISMLIHSTL